MAANYPKDTYINLVERFKSVAGLQALETTDASFLRQSVNRRIRTAYERYPWPDFTVIGESVAHTSKSIQTFGNSKALAYDANVIFRIHKENPLTTRYPDEYTFVSSLNAGGYPSVTIIDPGTVPANVFVTYRKDLVAVIKDADSTSSGFIGDENNDSSVVPYQFFEYAAFGAYADFLRGDGQTEKAQVEDQNAELILRAEIDKVRNQGRQFRHDVLQYRPQTQFRRHNLQAGGTPLNSGAMMDSNVQ